MDRRRRPDDPIENGANSSNAVVPQMRNRRGAARSSRQTKKTSSVELTTARPGNISTASPRRKSDLKLIESPRDPNWVLAQRFALAKFVAIAGAHKIKAHVAENPDANHSPRIATRSPAPPQWPLSETLFEAWRMAWKKGDTARDSRERMAVEKIDCGNRAHTAGLLPNSQKVNGSR